MNDYNSSNSEFDSEAEEAECRLYTELYFGEGNCEELLQTKNKEIILSSHNFPNYVNVGSEKDSGPNNNSKLTDYIQNDLSLIGSSISNTNNVARNYSNVNNSASDQFDSVNKLDILNENLSPVKGINACSRRRNISICSTDSISGKEPLDNLYCNYGNFEVSMINNHIRSSLDPIVEINSSNNYEDTLCYSRDEESRYCIKSSKSKRLNRIQSNISKKKSNSESSSEEEICIVPPDPPKFVEILTLDSEKSSSEESVQIVLNTAPVRKHCKRKINAKTKAVIKKLNQITSPIFLSSEDSEDSEYEFLKATSSPMSSLTINVRKDNRNRNTTFSQNDVFADRHVGPINFVKSQVIFSKSRPLTTRKPGCEKWTIEMSSLYDSDISEDFEVESIHASQTDDARKWKIIAEDYNVRPKNRYFNKQVRCLRCKEFGHHISKCPKIPHCLYCGSASHTLISHCPDSCCLRCGGGVHGYCHLTNNAMLCVLCKQAGHHAKLCPDIWRRFHATTKGSVPVKPKKKKKGKEKRIAYCYNCGKKGHYGHECGSNNYKKYSLVSSVAISYGPVDDILENLSFYRPGPNGQMSMTCPDNEGECSFAAETTSNHRERSNMGNWVEANNQRIFRMKSSRTADIMSKIKYVKKEIKARSGASVLYTLRPTKKYWKIIISGDNRSILEAEKIMNILLGKIPANEYSDLYSKVKDCHNLPSEITPIKSMHMSHGTITPIHYFTPSQKSTPLHGSTPKIVGAGSLNQNRISKSLIYSDDNTKTAINKSKTKKLSKKSLTPVTNENPLLEFAKKRASKYGTASKGKRFVNNSFIQSKKNSVISPELKSLFPVNYTNDKFFSENNLLDGTPDPHNKINELRKSRELLQISNPNYNTPEITLLNTSSSSKKKAKKSSGRGPNGRVLVKTTLDARDIINSKKESKLKRLSTENLNNNGSKYLPNLSKFFTASSDILEASKRKIRKTSKRDKIKVNCRMSLRREKYVVNSNKNAVSEIR